MASGLATAGVARSDDLPELIESNRTPPRIHYLDNLRAGAMLLGVLLHAAFAYAQPAQSLWLATDSRSSMPVDALIWWIHLFRMSLFFLISGFLAKAVIERRGVAQFLTGRLLRIVVPFVLFYPIMRLAFGLLIVFGLKYLPESRGLLGLIRRISQGELAVPPELAGATGPSTMHLWFLYYLALFSLIGAASIRFLPRRSMPIRVAPRQSGWLLAAAPLLLWPSVNWAGVPLPSPESFVVQLWPLGFYGLYYFVGWHWGGRSGRFTEWLDRLYPYRSWLLAAAMLLFVPYYLGLPVMDLQLATADKPNSSFAGSALEGLLTAYLSALWTLLAVLYGRQYLNRRNTYLKFLSDASYWVYLVHLPVVLFLQMILVPVACNVYLKLGLVMGGTLTFSLATYLVFVRYTPLGWLLHGRRQFP